MKPESSLAHCWLAVVVAGVLMLPVSMLLGATPASPKARQAIFDVKVDGKQAIAKALAEAKPEKKRVLLEFGANWCPWCHRLYQLFRTDPDIAAELKAHYVLVLIDVDKGHNAEVVETYHKPTRYGLPVLVVLDADGQQLTTQDTGVLEEGDHHDPEKVLAFLKKWASPRRE